MYAGDATYSAIAVPTLAWRHRTEGSCRFMLTYCWGMLAAGGLSTFASLAEAASLPSFLGSQSYFHRYLWRTTVTWDLGGNARAYPREKENIFHTPEPWGESRMVCGRRPGQFLWQTGYGDAFGGAMVYEITPRINPRIGRRLSGCVRSCKTLLDNYTNWQQS
jgi:hypothetical protein